MRRPDQDGGAAFSGKRRDFFSALSSFAAKREGPPIALRRHSLFDSLPCTTSDDASVVA